MLEWMLNITDCADSRNYFFTARHEGHNCGEDIVVLLANLIQGGIQDGDNNPQNNT